MPSRARGGRAQDLTVLAGGREAAPARSRRQCDAELVRQLGQLIGMSRRDKRRAARFLRDVAGLLERLAEVDRGRS